MSINSRFLVKFGLDCISNRNLVSRKDGEIVITAEVSLEQVQHNMKAIKDLIFLDVGRKVKQKIFNIEIYSINPYVETAKPRRVRG